MSDCDIIGGFPCKGDFCMGCGQMLTIENAWMTDGCPCNTHLGVNSMNETRWRLLMRLQQQQARELESIRDELAHMRTSEAIQDREALRENVAAMESKLFELISTAQRNGLSPSMAIAVGAKSFLERLVELEKPHEPPPAGESRMCLVCAYEKPWGVFDSKTGAAVCIDCRDKARSS